MFEQFAQKYLLVVCCSLLFAIHVASSPTARHGSIQSAPPAFALEFMRKFGYLETGISGAEAQYTEDSMTETVMNVQRFGNIPQTGLIDNATLELMQSSRCGVPDIDRRHRARNKRYIVASEGWKKRSITYYIANWSPKLGEEAVVEETGRAFGVWGPYSRLNFKQVNDPQADIIVGFGRGEHGDGYAFDGPGNVLAHAFFPYEMGAYGGDLHFDDDEEWKAKPTDPEEGTDYYSVAVHEIGHSLGLGHSPVPSSVMFPYYRSTTAGLQLGYDDILGVYQLYISRQLEGDVVTTEESTTTEESLGNNIPDSTTSTTEIYQQSSITNTYETTTERSIVVTYEGDYETVEEHLRREAERNRINASASIPMSTATTVPDICEGSFDAISVFREELFVFKGEYAWRLTRRGIVDSYYPVKFHQLFRNLPNNVTRIDAAYERQSDACIILFSGKQYWIYDGDSFIDGSPRPLTDYGISEDVERIDAVQVWGKNKKIYLYSGERFWRFNETSRTLDPGYPHRMRRWRGVPANIDAAMTWIDGKTYFFKEKLFWKFDNFLIKTESRYPKPAPQHWLGCPEDHGAVQS